MVTLPQRSFGCRRVAAIGASQALGLCITQQYLVNMCHVVAVCCNVLQCVAVHYTTLRPRVAIFHVLTSCDAISNLAQSYEAWQCLGFYALKKGVITKKERTEKRKKIFTPSSWRASLLTAKSINILRVYIWVLYTSICCVQHIAVLYLATLLYIYVYHIHIYIINIHLNNYKHIYIHRDMCVHILF